MVSKPKEEITQEAFKNYLFLNTISLLKLVELRMAIEIKIANLAAKNREKRHLMLLKNSIKSMQKHENDSEKCVELDDTFHESLIYASGNELFFIIFRIK